jgi:hypothetical protein
VYKRQLHIFVTIIIHGFVFFFLTMTGTYNLQNYIYCENTNPTQCNDFTANSKMILFYILFCFYFYFSGLQIYYGLLDMRKKALFKRGDNKVYYIVFKAYKVIPFLYEVNLTIDWSFTPTALDLFSYLKCECIYDQLFLTHCTMKSRSDKKVGSAINLLSKLFMGGGGFFLLMVILLGPLILFSSLNPTNIDNPVRGGEIELALKFHQEKKVTNIYPLFTYYHVDSVRDMVDEMDMWGNYNYDKSPTTKNFPTSQVQILTMSKTSDTIWDIAKPHIDTIIDRLENYDKYNYTITLNFRYKFKRDVI